MDDVIEVNGEKPLYEMSANEMLALPIYVDTSDDEPSASVTHGRWTLRVGVDSDAGCSMSAAYRPAWEHRASVTFQFSGARKGVVAAKVAQQVGLYIRDQDDDDGVHCMLGALSARLKTELRRVEAVTPEAFR